VKRLVKMTSKGRVTVPLEIRRRLGMRAGDHLSFDEDGRE
jgi:AbrB family looped-hinge helix DNA binding protein